MSASSSHLSNIPQAVRIAASTSNVDQALKEQAIEYLNKVKELSEETWQVSCQSCQMSISADKQDCLALYLQGAGAEGPGRMGKDGKEKLDTELRMFCEQVYEAALILK